MSLLYPNEAPLFPNFPSATKADWLKQVSLDLPGKNFDKLLLGKEVDGVKMYPFYEKENLDQDFINYRTFSDKAYTHKSWEFQEQIQLTDAFFEKDANALSIKALEQGTEALLFDCTLLSKQTDIPLLLQDIIPQAVSISWKLPPSWPANQWNYFHTLYGVIHLNPLEEFLAKGHDHQKGLGLLSALLQQDHPHLKKLAVNGQHFTNSGVSVIQEVALTCNLLVAYLDLLTDRGHKAQDLFNTLEISLGTRSAYFIDIAKYRAMQLLLHQLADTYAVEHKTQFPIRAVSSVYNKSAYDIHSNIVRNTSEAMAAVMGGCKTIAILPHAGQHTSEHSFARRIARNVSHILRHEAHLDLVQDPVAGSYALEALTKQITEQAWAYFLEIEKEGGILKAFEKGKTQNDIAQYASGFLDKVGSMKKVFVGSNRYVDASIRTPPGIQFLENKTAVDATQNLINISGPAVIESIRFKVDQAVAQGKARPKIGLISFNDKAKTAVLNVRFSFLQDLFASIGLNTEKLEKTFLSMPHPVEEWSGFDGLVLVSDDEQYALLKPEEIKEAMLSYKVPCMLAGRPEHIVRAWEDYGLYAFIHMGMNLPDFADKFFEAIKFGMHEA